NYCFAARAKSCSECLQAGVGCAYCPDESQVTPQQVTMSFLPGEEKFLDVEVFSPLKGPLDLYILMDFSNSMADDLDNLKKMGTQLSLVGELSDDYTIGFGKFVDKVIEPQTDMRPSLAQPWPNSDPPFSFKNVIRLTNDLSFYNSELQKERISGNLDAPEGGFDAILQAADKIGWRPLSTHLLVFSTESAFHYESDGINVLSGILKRNDEACHLDATGKYTEDTSQDYPSVPTLVRVLGENNIIPIFAVTNHSYTYYEELKKYFPIAEVGLLQEDSGNILEVMSMAFQRIRSKMSIRAEKPKAFEAQFLKTSGEIAQYGAFDFKTGAIGKFKMRLKAQQKVGENPVCQSSLDDRAGNVKVKPTTFNDAVNVQATVLCPTCDCEKAPSVASPRCHGNGDLVCGKCQCYDGVSTYCNCSARSSALDTSLCIGPDSTEPCSGRGDCLECGQCVCYNPDQFEGPYCQYDKTQCLRFGGFLCNDRGSCIMGRCVCTEGWGGDACECPISNSTCLDTSGCEATRTCVQCQAWKTGEKKEQAECDKCPFRIVKVEELKKETVLDSCSFRDEEDDCTYYYTVRMVGFKEDHLSFLQSQVAGPNHLDTPMVRTGPPKGTDVVRWKVTDNVHRGPNHPLALIKPNPRENPFPISLRLNRQFSESLNYPVSKDGEQLRKDVSDNLNEVYKQIPGVQKVQKTTFKQKNAGKQENIIMDTVLTAPRSSYPDIVKLTEKNVQSGNFHNLSVVPGYYTVATDREATGAVEFQEGVESLDVHVPLFVKDQDEDEKKLQVEALDVPLGIAEIGKKFVNITITKDHPSIFTFLQDNYTYSRKDGVANIPIAREIREDGRAQVSYRTTDHTAKDKKDYITVGGDLTYAPGETQKFVPVRLLELTEKDGLLEDKQIKKFYMDLVSPQHGAKLGRYPRTTVTIADLPSSQVMFKNPSQTFSTADPVYKIPVIRTHNPGTPATVRWRTKKAQRFDLSGTLKFDPKETEKDIVINPNTYPGPIKPENFQLELHDPGNNATLGERRSTMVHITDKMGFINQMATSPGGHVLAPGNPRAKATGPKSIRLNWDPPPGNPMGYKVKYWIYGDPEKDATVLDVKTPQAELTNLYPYCDYEMRVCGYNALGDGYDTDIVPCQTLEDPGEPGRLAFNVISPTVTQLSWAEPAETNGNITAYEVIYTPINDDLPVGAAKKVYIDNPKKRMLLIENLQTAQTYQYKVRAKNKMGWGPFRDATINLASQPARPLSVPIIPDIPIVDAEAGDEYDSYLMYTNEMPKTPGGSKTPSMSGDDFTMNGKWDQNFLFPGGSPSIGGGGLTTTDVIMRKRSETRPYTDENIRDSIVMGEVSSNFPDLARSPGVPETPSRLVFSALGPTALKVSWQEPHCEKDILGYCVLYQLLDVKRVNVTNPAENSVIIQDLLPNHSYLFKVKAQSQEGWGPEREGVITIESAVDPRSPLSPVPSPFTLSTPSAPGPLIFTALSPDSLQLSWDKPRKPNGDILGYVVTCEQLHGGDVRSFQVNGDSSETSLTVPNLTENVPYKFKVQARTTQGFGPEREGIITIESQDGALSQYNNQSITRREVFQLPTEVSTHTNVSHAMINEPYFS
uniref:Integrin beta n=1 Tax=Periophthalmus magnuspinnatus TaxID=409849 RepID=A0A3B4BB12_9GOBI